MNEEKVLTRILLAVVVGLVFFVLQAIWAAFELPEVGSILLTISLIIVESLIFGRLFFYAVSDLRRQ